MTLAWQLPLAAGNDWLSVVIFLIFVFGSFIVQMIKKAKGESGQDDETPTPRRPAATPQQRPVQPPRPSPGQTPQSEEIRKFLEALGKPRTATPPPVLRPVQQQAPRRPAPAPPRRPAPQPPPARRPLAPVSAEGVSEEGDEGGPPRNIVTGESTRAEFKPFERADLGKEMKAVDAQVEQAQRLSLAAVPSVAQSRAAQFAALLVDHSSVRRAVVLAEIIGPPKAFQ